MPYRANCEHKAACRAGTSVPQPEPPLPMENGAYVSVAARLYVERDSAGPAYRLSSKGAFTTKWVSWASLLILARWIIEQEEARHAR